MNGLALIDGVMSRAGWTLLLLTVRLLPLVILLPIFGGIKASPIVRSGALLALAIGFWPAEWITPIASWTAIPVLASQFALSLTTAACALVVFEAARMVGAIADVSLGRGSFGAADPLGGSAGPLSTFHAILFLAVFAASGSHVLLLRALADGITAFPLDATLTAASWAALVDQVILVSGAAIATAIALVLPALGVGLIVDVSLGWMNRAMPKLPVVFLAMPMRMVLGWIVVAGALAVGVPHLVNAAVGAFADATALSTEAR